MPATVTVTGYTPTPQEAQNILDNGSAGDIAAYGGVNKLKEIAAGSADNKPKLAITKTDNNGCVFETNPPVCVNTGDAPQPGLPTTPQTSRGLIQNTGIAVSNNNKVHVCDTTLYIRQKINLGKIAETVIIAIRDAIQELLKFLGVNPGTNGLVTQLKEIAIYIREKIEKLKEINAAIDGFIIAVKEIKAVIEYILNLPASLISYFLGCLKEAYAELAKQFADVVSQASGAVNDASGDIIDATKDVIKATGELIANATATVAKATTAIPTALTSPTTAAEKAKAEKDINTFVTEAYSDYTPVTDFKTP